MEYNILYNINDNKLEIVNPEEIMDNIYYLKYRVPTLDDLKKSTITDKKYRDIKIIDIKKYISQLEFKMPLYDVYTSNIYLINRENLYIRVNYNHYRFPSKSVLDELSNEYKELIKIKSDDIMHQRKIKKYTLIFEFMDNFDIKTLEDTYYRMIYKYSNELGKNIFFCKRPSFNKYIHNTKPYYTTTEIVNLALNMNIDVDITDKNLDLEKLCKIVKNNDINYKVIQTHQKYIIDSDLLGLTQYYTVQGSYFINSYLRKLNDYPYRNIFLDEIIIPMWNLCIKSPEFDNDYILYRFLNTDSHLENLKIGDIFQDDGFLSTTRDPFYKADTYQFGFILMKIKIPKNTKGVGLCIETVSHFPNEQEILFAPKTKFRLISRDSNTVYYHTDPKFSSQVKTRYEFEWVGNVEIINNKLVDGRIDFDGNIQELNFLEIKSSSSTYSLDEKIKYFINNYTNELKLFYSTIGKNKFLTCCEKYNSIGAYKDFYAINTNNGFSMYSLYKNYLVFFIELGETDKGYEMHVNYYVKYNTLNKEDMFTAEEFINFISSIAYYFDIDRVAIYPEYKPCFSILKDKLKDKKISQDITQITGNYCLDFYKYIKNKEKRFFMKNINILELRSVFNYYDLDLLSEINVLKVLNKSDDELYQLYVKTFSIENPKGKMSDFFVWIVDNKCYLIESLVSKLERLYKENNPFKKDIYTLNAIMYLYNKGFINVYGGSTSDIDFTDRKTYYIPTNEYRIGNTRR